MEAEILLSNPFPPLPPVPSTHLAISVVIPMYNTEKYIGACLESVLQQTFQNFEVIVVDDCSTDRSVEIVKNYIPKFEGRLKLFQLKKNSGGPGAPSNKGVSFSRGKYVYVIDNDDLILVHTLENLYYNAEKFNAEVVYMDKGFKFDSNPENNLPKMETALCHAWNGTGICVDKPTLETSDTGKRIEKFCNYGIGWPAWQKMVRRDFLIDNEIFFPELKSSADVIFTIEILCCSKNFLTIPFPGYLYRNNPGSITRTKRNSTEGIDFWSMIDVKGLAFLEKFLSKQDFFLQNPQYKYLLLNFFEQIHCNTIGNILSSMPLHEFYETLNHNFKEIFGEYGTLLAYLYASSNISKANLKTVMNLLNKREKN